MRSSIRNLTTKLQTDLLSKIKGLARERWVYCISRQTMQVTICYIALLLSHTYSILQMALLLLPTYLKRITTVSAQIRKNMTCYNEQGGATLMWEAAVDLHSLKSGEHCRLDIHSS